MEKFLTEMRWAGVDSLRSSSSSICIWTLALVFADRTATQYGRLLSW